MRKKSVEWTTNGREREGTPYYIIYRGGGTHPGPPWEGGRGKRGTENGTDAGSESRSEIYFDYAEQQGGKDREAGLKRKTNSPLRRFAPRPPNLEGQRKRGAGSG